MMPTPKICGYCLKPILKSDDGSRWLHYHPIQPYEPCGTYATPLDEQWGGEG